MELKELLTKPLPKIPPDIISALDKIEITKTPFDKKNDILQSSAL